MRGIAFSILAFFIAVPSFGDDGDRLLSVDHYVRVRSAVPAISVRATPPPDFCQASTRKQSPSKEILSPSSRPSERLRECEPGPICGRPPYRKSFLRSDRIACIHMSGLLMRLVTAGQDGFRDASSNQPHDLARPMGPTECLAPRIDRSYHLLLLQLRLSR